MLLSLVFIFFLPIFDLNGVASKKSSWDEAAQCRVRGRKKSRVDATGGRFTGMVWGGRMSFSQRFRATPELFNAAK
jgi:hypothetical protein